MENHPLYIGLRGYAGSGKDTISKMLCVLLSHDFKTFEDFAEYYNEHCGYGEREMFRVATNTNSSLNGNVFCVAFADQLKELCHNMFGVPLKDFYHNKEKCFVCINRNFEYTYELPKGSISVSAEEYYNNHNGYETAVWMSLRELLVYVGTYLMQKYVNRLTFINSLRNKVNNTIESNNNVNTIIVSDIRFPHEIGFIGEVYGITINITRPNIVQSNNIGEHSLDDYKDGFTYEILNDGSYKDLLKKVWTLVQNNVEFSNKLIYTYNKMPLRLIRCTEDGKLVYRVCCKIEGFQVSSDGVSSISIENYGSINIGDVIDSKHVVDIVYNQFNSYYEITLE